MTSHIIGMMSAHSAGVQANAAAGAGNKRTQGAHLSKEVLSIARGEVELHALCATGTSATPGCPRGRSPFEAILPKFIIDCALLGIREHLQEKGSASGVYMRLDD